MWTAAADRTRAAMGGQRGDRGGHWQRQQRLLVHAQAVYVAALAELVARPSDADAHMAQRLLAWLQRSPLPPASATVISAVTARWLKWAPGTLAPDPCPVCHQDTLRLRPARPHGDPNDVADG